MSHCAYQGFHLPGNPGEPLHYALQFSGWVCFCRPPAERTLLHAPRSMEQGPLRGVEHRRFNTPQPTGFASRAWSRGFCHTPFPPPTSPRARKPKKVCKKKVVHFFNFFLKKTISKFYFFCRFDVEKNCNFFFEDSTSQLY